MGNGDPALECAKCIIPRGGLSTQTARRDGTREGPTEDPQGLGLVLSRRRHYYTAGGFSEEFQGHRYYHRKPCSTLYLSARDC